ncbi:hypothetical protein OGAPHI_006234 [Ogataea philodendri]|uniref:Enhancer of polycomb-like protein n=1 Tax=Ogataea philodendri TaxID=1378263 RepID=A0A9P8NY45_9ASCO|nr:uncharacterized protein OGAPHI_006234 [Ogataea philodendri]KAH3662053.1 hypothetical protein OGAPHI_006234 [Ogataea philodendri]
MALPSSAGARFRQRKISVKQTLQVWKQKDIPDLELAEQQRDLQQFETGVEKGEEEEHHLQKVINASAAKIQGEKVEQVYIPTPDASKVWADAHKYYKDGFSAPATYIKFSATVEDVSGCPYCMDEEDEKFLEAMNSKSDNKCTEDEFEIIAHRFETVVNEKQPFLTMDPQQILSFKEIVQIALVPDKSDPADVARTLETQLNIHPFKTLLDAKPTSGKQPRPLKVLFDMFGRKIYEHWKARRIERHGKPVFPALKFEDPSHKDDNDPYVCFRRREFRQARKTRRTDTQGAERLELFYKDLKHARNLMFMVAEREVRRFEQIKTDLEIFNLRCETKKVKRELGVKGEEEDLITHKKKRPPLPDPEMFRAQQMSEKERLLNKERRKQQIEKEKLMATQRQRYQKGGANAQGPLGQGTNPVAVQPYVKLPSSRIPDLDLTTVNAVLQDKLEGIKKAVSDKLVKRRAQDEGWVNFTDDPYNPFFSIATNEDEALKERSHLPYSSIASSLYQIENSQETKYSSIFSGHRHYKDEDVVRINASDGKLVANDRNNMLPEFYDLSGQDRDYEDTGFYNLNNENQNKLSVSEVLYKLRKRVGRYGRTWIDRKRVSDDHGFEDYVDESDDEMELESDSGEEDTKEEPLTPPENGELSSRKRHIDVYDSQSDAKRRLKSRFMFDSDLPSYMPLDPSKLNQIGTQTQAIRFGCMLLTKAYDSIHHIRQKQIEAHQQRILQQQRLMQQKQKQLANGSADTNGSGLSNKSGSPAPGAAAETKKLKT